MTPGNLTLVACRLLALYGLYRVSDHLALAIPYFLQNLNQTAPEGLESFETSVRADAASMAASVAMFLVLWFCAGWIAQRTVPGTAEPPEAAPRAWSGRTALTVAATVFGVWAVISRLPTLAVDLPLIVRTLASARGSHTDLWIDFQPLTSELLTIGLGLFCILYSERIADFIARSRRWSADRS